MKAKLTPWFPPEIKPMRKGVYQVAYWSQERPSYAKWFNGIWRGSYSGISAETLRLADADNRHQNYRQNLEWRGLARKPK